jgi:hypothetical protein
MASTNEASDELEDEILSASPDDDARNQESTEEKAGGAMVATLFVGMILALAAVPLLLFGPLGLL